MTNRDEKFLEVLRATFQVEAGEHLRTVAEGLAELAKAPPEARRRELVETVYRAIHSLKGAARAVSLGSAEELCQRLESVLAGVRRGEQAITPALCERLQAAADSIEDAIAQEMAAPAAAPPSAPANPPPAAPPLVLKLATGRHPAIGPLPPAPADAAPPLPPAPAEEDVAGQLSEHSLRRAGVGNTVRMPTAKLDELLHDAEELLAAKLVGLQHEADLRRLGQALAQWERDCRRGNRELRARRHSGQHDPAQLQARFDQALVFLEKHESRLKALSGQLGALADRAAQNQYQVGSQVDRLLSDMKKILMLPFSVLLEGFPRLVRDLARTLDKRVELQVRGADVEIDKRILEELKDPFVHLLRNSIDHGIEPAARRSREGKPPVGSVAIAIAPCEGNKVRIEFRDDGAGIDLAALRRKAVRIGLLSASQAEALDERETLNLMYQSDMSTSSAVTEISGRGLGMGIVREKVLALGGRLSVETHPGQGTRFEILLPLTLATSRGILVTAGRWRLMVPTMNVSRVLRVRREDLRPSEGRPTVPVDEVPVALVRLDETLGLPPETTEWPAVLPVLILEGGDMRIAFLVDKIEREQEILVKPLGRQLQRVRHLAGATVLSSGEIVPILNAGDLLRTAARGEGRALVPPPLPAAVPAAPKQLLVVEDSLTSRMLLKNILATSGYQVEVAVDGAEALALLHERPFDLVVSDIQMPVMDGLELCRRIRADERLSQLPVVLVTTLDAPEDRRRGLESGANAYIVKSSFDQGDLLAIVEGLV